MLNILYTIIIAPLVQIIEFVFVFFYKIFHNLAIPLFGVSFVVSFLSLPLYMMAERWQMIERETVKRFKSSIAKIKTVFKGDEQFMVLSTFYRQNHYHPIYALRSSLGIFVQIPFFIAAYYYLSHLSIIRGISFKFIHDLGMPDSLFRIGTFPINVLPILMTAINCVAGAIYTKGLSLRDKVQVYGMALIFLVLLYNSPSCLVIYWTLNNIFSLVKNVFYRIKNPRKVLYILGCIICGLFIIYLLFFMGRRSIRKRILIVCILSIYFFLPLILMGLKFLQKRILSNLLQHRINMTVLLVLSCLVLAVLSGIYISSSVIASSPDEFCFVDNNASPFAYLFQSLFFYIGAFLLWPVCIYLLFSDKIKTFIVPILSIFALLFSIYTLLFSGDYGTISNTFNFNTSGILVPSGLITVLSLGVILLVVPFVFIIIKKNKTNILNALLVILVISFTGVSIHNFVTIGNSYKDLSKRRSANAAINSLDPIFSLSKTNKNVIVFMADGSVNGFVPLIFNEHPELNQEFDGFTLYRNTASFASHTLMGVPPIWGGYDYTPTEMNEKKDIPLVEKHNQALLTLPRLLVDAGFNVTVTDPSWANYAWIPDTSIYDNYKNITAFNTISRYTALWYKKNEPEAANFTYTRIKQNIIWFSFLKMNIPALRLIIYDNGWYWGTDNMGSSIVNFLNSYAVVDFLPELTKFDAAEPAALLITNETTHDFVYFSQPDFKPSAVPSKMGTGKFAAEPLFHSNTGFYLKFGLWLDLLRKNGVYDNTRIIIIADHGKGINGLLSDIPLSIKKQSRESYNPVLMVKDFNQHGPLVLNDDFMTNADVPALALQDLLVNPVNPFTGNPITTEPKKDGIFITTNDIPMADGHGKYHFSIRKDQWMYLHDSIFDASNWEQVEK